MTPGEEWPVGESVKAAADVFAPVSGEWGQRTRNWRLFLCAGKINQDAYSMMFR